MRIEKFNVGDSRGKITVELTGSEVASIINMLHHAKKDNEFKIKPELETELQFIHSIACGFGTDQRKSLFESLKNEFGEKN